MEKYITKETPTKLPLGRIRSFFKQLQRLAWLELFEKWFGLGVKLLWITLFVAFSIYLRKEYKKDIFYVQNFKVPPTWVEQGYSGEVVKQAIIDDIDNVANAVYGDGKSVTGNDQDGTEFLSDLSIDGFNIKAVTKSVLAVFGKKNKSIGGYITLDDSTQTVAIQVTDQITQPVSIKKNEPAQKLIHKATLEIMKAKAPGMLITHYMSKKDTIMAKKNYNYLTKHREFIKDYNFYNLSINMFLFLKQYNKAFMWSDSAMQKFPNDKYVFYKRAQIYGILAYTTKTDSATTRKNKRLFVENLLKVKEPGRTSETENNIDKTVDLTLANFYYMEKDYTSLIKLIEKTGTGYTLDAAQNNMLAYAYMGQKEYRKAEAALQRAVYLADDNGDYWDSLAELYSLQSKDSLAVVNLVIALASPQKSPTVSVEAYQKDTRWDRLRKRADFQALMKRKPR
jgi:tetratricopeptide (TPR) repeat protein